MTEENENSQQTFTAEEAQQQEPQTATAKPSWYEVLENTKEND